LVKKDKGQWYIYTKIPSQSRQQRFHEEARALLANEVKDNMWRVKVSIKTNVITVIGKAPIEQHSISTTTEEDATEVDWGITNVQQGDLTQLEEAIKKGVAVAVSDGSFQDSKGSAAWTIEGRNQAHRIRGSGRTPGDPEDQSAYRSELFGLWGIFRTIQKFIQDRNIIEGHVRIACDGFSAETSSINKTGGPSNPTL